MTDDIRSLARGPSDETSLVDVLDTVIERGVVVAGDVVLSVADVDLVHLGLRLVLRGLDEPMTGMPVTGGPAARTSPAVGPPPQQGEDLDRGPQARRERAAGEGSGGERPGGAPRRGRATGAADEGPDLAQGVASQLDQLVDSGRRGEASSEDVQRGLAGLVLALVEVLRELMERQALRRMRSGSVNEDEVERLGSTFIALRERMEELKDVFGLTDEDLNLDLGPLGRLR